MPATGGGSLPTPEPYHALEVDAVLERFAVTPDTGLTAAEATARLEAAGPNELAPPRHVSVLSVFIEAITEPFVVMLALAGGLAVLLGETRDGLLVLLGLVPIVGADVATSFRAERALEELRKAASPRAHVRRDGAPLEIPASDLVAGDVVLLRVGDVVPADLRVLRSDALTLDRSVLTGESLPEEAAVRPDAPDTVLADRHSMVYAGTSVVLGRGEGIVVATLPSSELGQIAGALGPTERGHSPLQRELARLVRILVVVATGLIVVTVSLNLLRGAGLGAAVLAGISAAIAAIPEEPPVLLAVILGLGAYRLLRRDVLVRRLNAQETLGAVDLIITDKTGTLTENRLSLDALLTLDGPVLDEADRRRHLVDALRAEEDAWNAGPGLRTGSFTRALVGAIGGLDDVSLDRADLVSADPPRDGRPYSRTVAGRDGVVEELALGAPEAVLALSEGPGLEIGRWHALVDGAAEEGRRLLLLSGRRDDGPWMPRTLLSFSDTLRAGVPGALRVATEAGIQTVVVTGDHRNTAIAIARAAGIDTAGVVTGSELDALDDEGVRKILPRLGVVARATPEQKLRLVLAALASRRTVAVTGDGVNDAPALERADVGVAMGSGTAVAREAADLVLGDDSFVTLMNALAEGRRIVANVQKGLVFLTSTHVALLGFIFIATLAGFGQPLLPIQILWLELFIDLAASIAFEQEPAEPDSMRRPARPRDVPLLTRGILLRVAFAGGVTAVASLALMIWAGGGDEGRWLAFNALVFGQLVRAYANRSLDHPVSGLSMNRFLLVACLVMGVIQLSIPYIAPLADTFRASPLDSTELALIAVIAVVPAIAADVIRRLTRTVWVA
ncbi:MAG TPA: cation-transporting P-type ATPase [Candidatus Limnocylindrales bacterium]